MEGFPYQVFIWVSHVWSWLWTVCYHSGCLDTHCIYNLFKLFPKCISDQLSFKDPIVNTSAVYFYTLRWCFLEQKFWLQLIHLQEHNDFKEVYFCKCQSSLLMQQSFSVPFKTAEDRDRGWIKRLAAGEMTETETIAHQNKTQPELRKGIENCRGS